MLIFIVEEFPVEVKCHFSETQKGKLENFSVQKL